MANQKEELKPVVTTTTRMETRMVSPNGIKKITTVTTVTESYEDLDGNLAGKLNANLTRISRETVVNVKREMGTLYDISDISDMSNEDYQEAKRFIDSIDSEDERFDHFPRDPFERKKIALEWMKQEGLPFHLAMCWSTLGKTPKDNRDKVMFRLNARDRRECFAVWMSVDGNTRRALTNLVENQLFEGGNVGLDM